jgi:hypothetical protein
MSASNYLETELLKGVLTGNTYTAPGNVYAALYTTALDDTVSGTEISGNGYSRQSVAFAVTDNLAENTGNVTFTCSGNAWGTVRALALWDASTAGNALFWTNITPIAIDVSDEVQYLANTISVSLE